MKINVLDYGVIDKGETSTSALQQTVELAQLAESLGYHRFWVAEHHNVDAFAISAPEMMMAHIAANTKTIRVGSGGIMGLHYSPYKVAESISTLLALHPNRIDLGIGNSLGTGLVQRLLKSQYQKGEYASWLETVKVMLSTGKVPKGGTPVFPQSTSLPEMFTLSNSDSSAKMVGQLGLGYTFGIFPYMPKDPKKEAKKVCNIYRESFERSAIFSQPKLQLATFVVIADDQEKAEALARSLDVWMLGENNFKAFKTMPTIEEAKAYNLTEKDKTLIEANRKRMIVGDPITVKNQLEELLQASSADELMVIPLVPGISNRKRAIELLAQMTFNN